LVRWGVTPDADLVYRALVTVGPQASSDAAQELGMPRRRVNQAIEELSTSGAVQAVYRADRSRRAGRPEVWRANDPHEVIHRLRRRQLRLVDPWELAQRHLATVAGLNLSTAGHAPAGDQVRLLRGIDLIRDRIAELAKLERHEHLSMNPEQAISAPAVAAAAPLDRALLLRGGKLQVLGVPPADGDATSLHREELTRLGAEQRVAKQLPLKVMVFDRKVAMLPLNLLAAGNGVLEISEPGLVRSLVSVILREWNGARDPRRPDVPALDLSPRERALLDLLAAGHTDTGVARRLGVSARTVGYAMRGLMDRLHVENRFQLGLALGAQGVYAAPSSSAH
jgi:DNA-binding CsgD family transcriptional regulator